MSSGFPEGRRERLKFHVKTLKSFSLHCLLISFVLYCARSRGPYVSPVQKWLLNIVFLLCVNTTSFCVLFFFLRFSFYLGISCVLFALTTTWAAIRRVIYILWAVIWFRSSIAICCVHFFLFLLFEKTRASVWSHVRGYRSSLRRHTQSFICRMSRVALERVSRFFSTVFACSLSSSGDEW